MNVETVSEARSSLSRHLLAFRQEGVQAEPVLIGGHRKPEAALIPSEMYEELLPRIEELRLKALVAERIATDQSHPLSELIEELGLQAELDLPQEK